MILNRTPLYNVHNWDLDTCSLENDNIKITHVSSYDDVYADDEGDVLLQYEPLDQMSGIRWCLESQPP